MAVYACSDLHGRLDLYKQIKAFLNPEDTVYFLGDAGDRGPDSWELIKTIYSDDQFVYLMGNHEEMLVEAMKDWLDYFHCGLAWQDLINNGGAQTFEDWRNIPNESNQRIWMRNLKQLLKVKTYVNKDNIKVILSHAGFTPGTTAEVNLLWDREHYDDEWDEPFMLITKVKLETLEDGESIGFYDDDENYSVEIGDISIETLFVIVEEMLKQIN